MKRINPRARRDASLLLGVLLVCGSAPALAMPRYIADLLSSFHLDAGVVNGSKVRFLAGREFFALAPESRLEVCQLLREYYVATLPGTTSVEIVNATTQATLSCK